MNNTSIHRFSTLAFAAGVMLLSAGCAEKLAEKGAESLIERQIRAEGGGDVDIDLDGDGGFAIQTPEGEIRIGTDGAGGFSIDGTGEDGDFSATGDGGGNMVIDGPDGSAVIRTEDGNSTIESDEGSFEMTTGTDLPDGFPSDISIPSGLNIVSSQKMSDGDEILYSISGTSTGDLTAFAAEMKASLEISGYVEESVTTAPDTVFAHYVRGETEMVDFFAGSDGDGGVIVTMSVTNTG